MTLHGARYLHVLVPCPLGWGHATDETIQMSRLAIECGLFPVFEAVDGELERATPIRHRVGVEAYLRPQKRFAHLFTGDLPDPRVARLQAMADDNIRRFAIGGTP
jgi:pyruvate ferredoxin oxidoreductase beta subunit